MMNMDIESIVREKCAELGIEYDDSITKALENGEALSEDVTIEMKAMYEGLARKNGQRYHTGRRQIEIR